MTELKSVFTKIVVVFTLLGITAGGTWKISYDQGHEEGYIIGNDAGYVSGHTIGWDLGHMEGYNEGYDRGEDFGYTSGNIAGIYTGRQEGHASGFAEGRESGWNDGRDDGIVEGKLIGFDEGYEVGYDEGADIGYDEGVNFGYLEGVVDGAGHGYNLRDPTYREAIAFMSSDRTDLNKYIVDVYTCRYFTRDFIENAMDQGYQCHYVSIRYEDGAHAIVAFNTVDRGIIYIEPQNDKILTPKVGEPFYPRDQYSVTWDDTIIEIMMIP